MERTKQRAQAPTKLSLKVSDLTDGEKLIIDRRRLGETQGDAAQRLGMPESSYCCAELNQPCAWDVPTPALGKLEQHEMCLIRRMRSGYSQAAIAKRVGVSRYWLCQMERGIEPCERLVGYWAS